MISNWKKLNLARIIIFSLAYIAYALYLILAGEGIYIINILLLISANLNAVLSLIIFFIDDEDRQKTAKRTFKKFKKTTKLFVQVLKFVILAGSFIIYADERSATSLALASIVLAITVIGIIFDIVKKYMSKLAREAVHAVGKGIDKVKDTLHLSTDWYQWMAENGKKYTFKAKEKVEWWTRFTLRRKGVADGNIVKYDGKLVYFANKDDVYYVEDSCCKDDAFLELAATLKDYKYLQIDDAVIEQTEE